MRHPKIYAACLAFSRAERRGVVIDYVQQRANESGGSDPRFVDAGDGIEVSVHTLDDAFEVTVYRPASDVPLPIHVYLHGGAFCYGSTRRFDGMLREFAAAGMVVVSVDYRLAPEHPWPQPVEDAYSALTWAHEHAAELGGSGVLTLGGSSSGGTIAAATSLVARDRGGPALAGQLLDIPATDLTMSTGESIDRYARGYLSNKAHLAESYELYVPDPADRRHPYASPLFAADFAGLPPTVLVTAEYDPLRDEGEAYAARLRAAGVPVTAIRARGHVHSSNHSALPSAVRIRRDATTALRRWQAASATP